MAKITAGELVYKITGDSSGLKGELSKADKAMGNSAKAASKFGTVLKASIAGAAVIAAGRKLVGFFSDAVKAASDAEETAQKFGVVYRDIAATANKAASDIAMSFGVAKTESKKLLGDTGDLLTGFGFTQKAALDLSDQVVRLGLDLSSFANVDQDFAVEGLRKALLGETEQAKSLGIVVNQTTKEFRAAVKQKQIDEGVTLQQAKAMTILEIATKQSKNAIGDFARSASSYANQQKIINARIKDFKVAAGGPLKDALKLMQKDFIEASADAENIGTSIGTIAGKAVLSFRIARDAVNKWIAEFYAYLSKMDFRINKFIAETASSLGQKDIANLFARSAIAAGQAWEQNNKDSKKYNKRLNESLDAWDKLGKKQKKSGKDQKGITSEVKKTVDGVDTLAKKYDKLNSKIQGFGSSILSVFSAIQALQSAITESRISDLDAQMEAELMAAGVAEQTTVEQAQLEYDEAMNTGTALEQIEKKKALDRAKIEEKYLKKKAKLEYEGALVAWQLQTAMAVAQAPLAVLNAISAGWRFGGPVLAGIYGALAGAASAIQIAAVVAAKPQPPKFAEGGIVPGSSYSGDKVSAQVNSGEMVLNKSQQKQLFDIANGGGGGGTINMIIDGTVFGKVLYNMSKNGDLVLDAGALTLK